MSGTRIRAECGDVSIEALQAGDKVTVFRNGEAALEKVLWVGRSSIDLSQHVHVEVAAPVRIRRNAVADDMPARDLFLSPEHCLIIEGLCMPAKLLVNGGSIVSERHHAPFTYYHIELDRHGILLAENTPAESYLDTGNRSMFDNSGTVRELYPAFTLDAASTRWLTDACAPLARVPDDVAPIWHRLAERSAALGYPVAAVATMQDAGLHLVADGRVIWPAFANSTQHVFLVPAAVNSLFLTSRFYIPADQMIPGQRDTRRLGVGVSWLSISRGANEARLPVDHPTLDAGWNAVERDARAMWRWTDGNASIPWHNVPGSAVLTVRCTRFGAYPVAAAASGLAA